MYSQLGHDKLKQSEVFKRVDSLKDKQIVKVACGGGHTVALSNSGMINF